MEKVDKKNIEDILPLTPMQEGMLFHYQKNPGKEYYLEQLELGIAGEIDITLFEKAWNFVIETNEMLRTSLRWEKVENPIQITHRRHRILPGFHDFSKQISAEIKTSIEKIKIKEREKIYHLHNNIPFNIALCKTGSKQHEMIITNHHILYDGWSNGIILKEFIDAYNDFSEGKKPKKPGKPKFKEFIRWIQGRDTNKQLEYWSNYLGGLDCCINLSIKKRKIGENQEKPKKIQISIPSDLKDELDNFVKKQKITASTVLYTGWGILLQKYNNTDDAVFGTTVSGRSAKVQGIEETVGLFINTIPLRVLHRSGEKIETLLHFINKTLQERENYETVSLADLKKCIQLKINSELFDSIVIVENYPLEKTLIGQKGKLSINSYSMMESTHYDLTIGITVFGDIEITFIYCDSMFDVSSIDRMSHHYLNVIRTLTARPGDKVSEIEVITQEEKNRILYEFNKTAVNYARNKTVDQLFEDQCCQTPDAAVLYWTKSTCITYKELNHRANQVSLILREKGGQTGSIAGIMMEESPELATGILGILKSGSAYLPIDPGYPEERVRFMLADSAAGIALSHLNNINGFEGEVLQITSKPQTPYSITSPHPQSRALASGAAYIIYTSGTTGKPKGVILEHRSVVNTLLCRKKEYKMVPGDRSLLLFSYTFDGFVTAFFTPIISGAAVIHVGENGRKDITGIIEAIVAHGVTHFITVPPLYREIIENIDKKETATLKVVTLAGDSVAHDLLEMTTQKNPRIEISHEYGVTEAAIMSTVCRHQQNRSEITIGKPIWNNEIFIVDKQMHLQPPEVPGELCISGTGIAWGYLNNPELTVERFYRSDKSYRPNTLYKTGDMARWHPGGNIEFMGRIDHQVKIRGFRIEPGEIENRLLNCPGIKEALVLARQKKSGEKYLCAYLVLLIKDESSLSYETTVKEFLGRTLPQYMIPAHFIILEKIPLTPTGKINRGALPEPEITMIETYSEAQDDVERRLRAIWSEILEVAPSAIGIDHDFFRLGGHSLKATRLISKVHKEINIKVPLDFLFQNPTIRGLATYLKKSGQEEYIPIPKAEKREYYPLSAAQKRLYITQHMELESTAYNVLNITRLEGRLSLGRLAAAFQKLIDLHEIFKTSFEVIHDEPVQRIRETVEFAINQLNSTEDVDSIISRFVRPFDLSRPPLLRAGLIKMGEEDHLLLTDIHHIIADGVSMRLFLDEFSRLYGGEELSPPGIQYKDFSLWQIEKNRSTEGIEVKKKQETYWLTELGIEIPRLNLPLDFPRPTIQQYEGSSFTMELDGETTALLKKLADETDTTLFMLLLSICDVFLAKICAQEDVVLGAPAAGREHADLERVMGLFVNMLVHRCSLSAGRSFLDFLKEVKEKMLNAYANRDYPFEELVEKLSITREAGRNSLFDFVFVWEETGIESSGVMTPGRTANMLKITPYSHQKARAMFDIILTGTESMGKISFLINYRTSLFKRETIESMSENFKEVLLAILKYPEIKLDEIAICHDLLAARSHGFLEDEGDFGF
jgi:amino acid adenylation domain-containing protein